MQDKNQIAERLYLLRYLSTDDDCKEFVELVDQLRFFPSSDFDTEYFRSLSMIFFDQTQSYEVMQELHTFLEQKYRFQRTLREFWVNLKASYKNYSHAIEWYRFYLMGVYRDETVRYEIDNEINSSTEFGLFIKPIMTQIKDELES